MTEHMRALGLDSVMQSKLQCPDGIHAGNCFAACLATLLSVPLWMVPPFEDMRPHAWQPRCDAWLRRMFGARFHRETGHPPIAGFYMAVGPSDRGVSHAVIYHDGHLAHDPHPAGTGIHSVDWCAQIVEASS